MDPELESKLMECLEGLEAGLPLATLLSRYPAEADTLRPMLETAAKLSAIKVAHSVSAETTSRRLFLAKAAEMGAEGRAVRPGQFSFWRRLMLTFASFLLFFVVGGVIMGGLARNALPGDWLYPVKLGFESGRLRLTNDPAGRALLEHEIEEERLAEIYQLLATGREGRIEYTTVITQISPTEITVHDLAVQITAETMVEGEPKAGSLVHLVCEVRSGRVFAVNMRVLSSPPPATDTPTQIPTNIATLTPVLPTDAPSITQQPSSTHTPTLTSTSPSPSPHSPGLTPYPTDTDEPDDDETPQATDEPDDDETPEATDEPDDDETPEATDEPDDDETPEATDEPDDDDETPEATDEPGDDD